MLGLLATAVAMMRTALQWPWLLHNLCVKKEIADADTELMQAAELTQLMQY